MALNPDFVGRTYPPAPAYLVGREKIREFARAVQLSDLVYFDVEVARAR